MVNSGSIISTLLVVSSENPRTAFLPQLQHSQVQSQSLSRLDLKFQLRVRDSAAPNLNENAYSKPRSRTDTVDGSVLISDRYTSFRSMRATRELQVELVSGD